MRSALHTAYKLLFALALILSSPGMVAALSADVIPPLKALGLLPGERLKVVATTSIVADVVKNVGGDKIELSTLLPIGVDPHSFEPSPKDLRAVADADVIFANGFGLEEFLDKLIRNSGSKAPVVPVSAGVEGRPFAASEDKDHSEDEHSIWDPHTWTDPNNVLIWVQNIERALSTLDPKNARAYRRQAETYSAQLRALDDEIRSWIAEIPPGSRKLVVDHKVFGYFARRYGMEMVGAVVESYSTVAEPSAKELSELERKIESLGVKAIFVGVSVNPKIAQRISRDTGVRLVPLYTGSLSDARGPASDYLAYMRYNVEAIVSALR
ncbi:MAG: metal ABC transporter substrate-binding protein [bacterium]